MFGIDDAVIGSVLGGVISGAGSFFGGQEQADASAEAVREQDAFQERMSSTAYQRAVTDMRAAGINPMLAATVGGASSPAGAMPNVLPGAGLQGAAAAVGGSIAGAGALQQSMDLQKAQVSNIEADTSAKEAQRDLAVAQAFKTTADRQATEQATGQSALMMPIARHQGLANVAATEQGTSSSATSQQLQEIQKIIQTYGISAAKADAAKHMNDPEFWESSTGRALRSIGLGGEAVLPGVEAGAGAAVGAGSLLKLFKP